VLHGIEPYVYGPASAPADPAFAHVTWPHTTSAYGPIFTLASYPLAWLPVEAAVYAFKAASALSVFAIAVLVARLAPQRGVEPLRAAAFVALNPLVLVHVVGGPHNDAFAVLLTMAGIAAMLRARELSAGAACVAAAAIKASAAIVFPFAFVGSLRPTGRKWPYIDGNRLAGRFLAGAGVVALLVGGAAYAAFGWHWLDAFALAGESQGHTSHLSLPTTFARISGVDKEAARTGALVLFATLIAYLLVWTYRGGDWLRAAAWATTALLLATSWLLPWYLLWPLPLAALSRDRALQLLLLALTAYQLGARIPL
jgi:hypothetical protein